MSTSSSKLSPRELDGRVAIVTGAGGGLGAAMARSLAAAGARVVVADVSETRHAVAEELGDVALAMDVDVTSSDSVAALVQAAKEHFGRLDVLCNNAGVDGDIAPLAELPLEAWNRVIAVNLTGVYLGIHHAVPVMLETGGGSIINTASATAVRAAPGVAGYIASKAGVLGLTRAAAAEYSGAGIRVNAISPGIIQTPMLELLDADTQAYFRAKGEETMSGRIGRPEEIGAVTVFLASDASSYVTGVTLPVDGGYVA